MWYHLISLTLLLLLHRLPTASCQQYLDVTDDPCFYNTSIHVRNVANCLQRVKTAAADSRQLWFGQTWKSTCHNPPRAVSDWIKCYNPTSLQRFTNVGSRLLRVQYFNLDFLRNLDLFPEVTFDSPPGKYSGCDHVFGSDSAAVIQALPLMSPIAPWSTRLQPKITWPGQSSTTFYTVAIVDVGFGYINYLAYNYPYDTTIVKEYEGLNNFREEPNPYAVVVFRQPEGRLSSLQWHNAMENDSTFNIQTFMIDNNFQQSLVGLNWITVGTDAYAIQLQKDKNLVDNCPALIRNRLYSRLPGHSLTFLPESDLHNVDTWITVQYNYGGSKFTVCCQETVIQPGQIRLDPIGDGVVGPVQSRDAPLISVTQSLPPDMYNYRRTSREFVALMDSSLYTLMLVSTDTLDDALATQSLPFVYWLITNIPGNSLQSFREGAAGDILLAYSSPLPYQQNSDGKYVFVLMQQVNGPVKNYQNDLYSPETCPAALTGRCRFNMLEFMARNSLKVKGLSWMLSRTDSYVLWNFVNSNGPESESSICSKYGLNYNSNCQYERGRIMADFSRGDAPQISSSNYSSGNQKTLFTLRTLLLSVSISILRLL